MNAISALPGKTVNEKLRSALVTRATGTDSPAMLETLELVRTIAADVPTAEQIETILEGVIDRAKAARSQLGAGSSALNHCAHCDQDYPRPVGQPGNLDVRRVSRGWTLEYWQLQALRRSAASSRRGGAGQHRRRAIRHHL